MTKTQKPKQANAIETWPGPIPTTPKEWSIWMVDQIRWKNPSEIDFNKPFKALKDKADRLEYATLIEFVFMINSITKSDVKIHGMEAELKLSQLGSIVLQDAFGRTARKAVEWVEEYKPADPQEDENRQAMILELKAYADLNHGEKWSDSIPLGTNVRFRFPSAFEECSDEVLTLTAGVFMHHAAIQAIQFQKFDGHSILFKNVEDGLNRAIQSLNTNVQIFNYYLKTRAALFEDEWKTDEEENEGISTAIPGEREGRLTINIKQIEEGSKHKAKAIASLWFKTAKAIVKAEAEALEGVKSKREALRWSQFRESEEEKL